MIYLIKCEGRIENEDKNRIYYKIGYTKDSNFERRIETYYLHNPFCKVLYKIPGGTERHESLIHNRFKNLRVYRREWFEDDGSIVNFFNTYKTVDDLNNVLGVGDPKYFVRDATGKLTKEFQNLRSYIKNCLNIFYNKKVTSLNLITTELISSVKYYVGEIGKSIFTEDDFLDKFEEDRGESIRQVMEENEKLLKKPILEFIEKFNSLSNFNDKLKALCEEDSFSESEISVILDQIPLIYKKYYLVLGPGRCKANGYNVTDIKREYEDTVMDKEDISTDIYQYFTVGGLYSNKEIKDKLAEIYNKHKYGRTPKASDLENYFKVVNTKKTVGENRIRAMKIVEKL